MRTPECPHGSPDGLLTTLEGLPRCPLCRIRVPGYRPGPRPRRRAAAAPYVPTFDPAARAAADDTLL